MTASNGRRVAVTGLGFIPAIGNDRETVWSNLVEGASGVGPITYFDTTAYSTRIAAQVKDFDPELYMDRKTARHIGRYCQFALAASKQALAESGLQPGDMDPDDVGVIVSSGIGGMEEIEKSHTALMECGVRRISPFTVPMMIADMAAGIVAYGASADMYRFPAPPPEGLGASRAMKRALDKSGVAPAEVGYINAHGTSTKLGDIAETKAIKAVFGEHAYELAVSSTKSVHAHLLGAAGAMEAAACVMALQEGVLPPTINLDHQDPACDLDYVPNKARRADLSLAMSNSFGFGGHNATLLIRKPELN